VIFLIELLSKSNNIFSVSLSKTSLKMLAVSTNLLTVIPLTVVCVEASTVVLLTS